MPDGVAALATGAYAAGAIQVPTGAFVGAASPPGSRFTPFHEKPTRSRECPLSSPPS